MKQQACTAKLSPSSLAGIFFAVVMLSSRAAIPTYTTLTGRAAGSVPEGRMQAHSSSRSGATCTFPPPHPHCCLLFRLNLQLGKVCITDLVPTLPQCAKLARKTDERNLSGEE